MHDKWRFLSKLLDTVTFKMVTIAMKLELQEQKKTNALEIQQEMIAQR